MQSFAHDASWQLISGLSATVAQSKAHFLWFSCAICNFRWWRRKGLPDLSLECLPLQVIFCSSQKVNQYLAVTGCRQIAKVNKPSKLPVHAKRQVKSVKYPESLRLELYRVKHDTPLRIPFADFSLAGGSRRAAPSRWSGGLNLKFCRYFAVWHHWTWGGRATAATTQGLLQKSWTCKGCFERISIVLGPVLWSFKILHPSFWDKSINDDKCIQVRHWLKDNSVYYWYSWKAAKHSVALKSKPPSL